MVAHYLNPLSAGAEISTQGKQPAARKLLQPTNDRRAEIALPGADSACFAAPTECWIVVRVPARRKETHTIMSDANAAVENGSDSQMISLAAERLQATPKAGSSNHTRPNDST